MATFGETNESQSGFGYTRDAIYASKYTPTSNGDLTKISAYMNYYYEGDLAKAVIYESGSGDLKGYTVTGVGLGVDYRWYDFTFDPSVSITSGQRYYLGIMFSSAGAIGTTFASLTAPEVDFSGGRYNDIIDYVDPEQEPPNPEEFSSFDSTRNYCIYGTYTPTEEDVYNYTSFQTPTGLVTGWSWNSGQYDVASGMKSSIGSGTQWEWSVISSSAKYWYPSGSSTNWIWVSGNTGV